MKVHAKKFGRALSKAQIDNIVRESVSKATASDNPLTFDDLNSAQQSIVIAAKTITPVKNMRPVTPADVARVAGSAIGTTGMSDHDLMRAAMKAQRAINQGKL